MELLKDWFRRSFSDPQVVILGLVLVVFFAVVVGLGAWLAPMFASIVIAYLLEAVVNRLQRLGMPRDRSRYKHRLRRRTTPERQSR